MTNTNTAGRSELERLVASAKAAQQLANHMLATNVETDEGLEAVARGLADAGKAAELHAKQERGRELTRRVFGNYDAEPRSGWHRLDTKAAAESLTDKMAGEYGAKALAPSGTAVAPAGLTEIRPFEQGRVQRSLLSVLPTQTVAQPPTVSYLRQTTRTNNAAAVASGATKPTSTFGLARVDDTLRVVAHLSENVDRYWLGDHADLRRFVGDELAYGLDEAIEAQIVNGDGLGPNMTGILATSGIQAQAWSTDGWETVRRGLTALQTVGGENPVLAINPVDWQTMSLLRGGTGLNSFVATDTTNAGTAPPVAALAQSAWGIGVVLSTALPVGTGLLFDQSAVVVYTDGQVRVEWDSASGFDTNQLRARCETRALVAVVRPPMVVELDMSAA